MKAANKQAKGPWACQPVSDLLHTNCLCIICCTHSAPVAVAAEGRAQVAAGQRKPQQAVNCVCHHGRKL